MGSLSMTVFHIDGAEDSETKTVSARLQDDFSRAQAW